MICTSNFVVTASLVRDGDSFSAAMMSDFDTDKVKKGTPKYTGDWQGRAQNSLIFKKFDLENNLMNSYTASMVQSVDVYNKYDTKQYVNRDQPYFDSTTGRTVQGNTVPTVAQGWFNNLYQAKSSFYGSAGSFVDSNRVKVSQGYKEKFDGYYYTYNNLHYGLDIVVKNNSNVSVEGANIMAGLSGQIISNTMELGKGKGAGNSVHIEYGYKFEDSLIGTGIYGEYNHFQQQSTWKVGSDVNATTVLGTLGNTGNSTGPHLHYSVYTTGRNNYSDSTMRLLFGRDYSSTMMQSVTTHDDGSKTYNSKFVYDPTIFYERNQKGRLQ